MAAIFRQLLYLVLLVITPVALVSCSDEKDERGSADASGKNPFSGVSTETDPSEISGAWLTSCDIETLGKATGGSKDVFYCRSESEKGNKASRNISFFSKVKSAIQGIIKQTLSADSYYTAMFQVPSLSASSFKDESDKSKEGSVDYRVFDISTFNWSGVSAPITDSLVAQGISAVPLALLEDAFCNADGTVRPKITLPNQIEIPGVNVDIKPNTTTPGKSCYGPLDLFSKSFNKGDYDVSKVDADLSINSYVIGGGSGSKTGCLITVIYQKDAAGNSISSPRFAILDKSRVKTEMKDPKDVSISRLKSAAYAGKCTNVNIPGPL